MTGQPTGFPKKRALVASDSDLISDPRVLNQVRWLTERGWIVDTLGRGDKPVVVNGCHWAMKSYSFPIRLFCYVFLSNRARFRVLIGSTIPQALREKQDVGPYDLAVINEIDLLPWFTTNTLALVKAEPVGHSHLDLHEYSPSQGVGVIWKLLIGNYRKWLISFIPSAAFNSRSVVAPGIADLYVDLFHIPRPAIVRSCPAFVDQEPSLVDGNNVRLIHHGKADPDRGLDILIDAMAELDEHFSLTLMLVGDPAPMRKFRASAARFGNRVIFRDPVPVAEVATALNGYDLEVIFFPPTTENLLHALPNKFFEAVQGRLGIVVGGSPEMVGLVREFDNGIVVEGWTAADLAKTISALDAPRIHELKHGSATAAVELSSESEKSSFLDAIGELRR